MITNKNNKVLYTGVTNDLDRRIIEHKQKAVPGFSRRYNLTKLVYYEHCFDVNAAIAREKQLKGWVRQRKNELVNAVNPLWLDLSVEINRDPSLRSG
jgi:putative endonuclease